MPIPAPTYPLSVTDIKPALAPDEWDAAQSMGCRAYFQATSDLPPPLRVMALDFDQFRAMAVANFALAPFDSRKITQADVKALRRAAQLLTATNDVDAMVCEDIAAKLAALLPP